ncbi:MAG: metallophosphoesterase family protein [Pseudomonadota bacterium]
MITRIALMALVVGGLGIGSISFAHEGHKRTLPPWQMASPWPDRVAATVTSDPTTSFSVTWRTDDSVGRPRAQIVKASANARFDIGAVSTVSRTEVLDTEMLTQGERSAYSPYNQGIGRTHHHSVTFEKLEPDTLYAYRVEGAKGHWSSWYQLRTAPKTGPMKMIYFGDAQNGILSHWSRMIRMAGRTAPDARFMLHAGDLVDKSNNDRDWGEWFTAGGYWHATPMMIPVAGNHEHMRAAMDDGTNSKRVLTPFWQATFTLPIDPSLPKELQEQVYESRLTPEVHVFVLSSTLADFELQAQWLDKRLAASDARWKIVTMHHPYFAPAAFDRNERDAVRRAAFAPVIDKHDVDLVLVGHIHFYNRISEVPEGDTPSARVAKGEGRIVDTMYVISSSGAKVGGEFPREQVESEFLDGIPDLDRASFDRVAGNTPMFQVMEFDGPRLSFTAYTGMGKAYDAFTLEDLGNGKNRVVDGEAAYGDTRYFGNTGPYEDWREID